MHKGIVYSCDQMFTSTLGFNQHNNIFNDLKKHQTLNKVLIFTNPHRVKVYMLAAYAVLFKYFLTSCDWTLLVVINKLLV